MCVKCLFRPGFMSFIDHNLRCKSMIPNRLHQELRGTPEGLRSFFALNGSIVQQAIDIH
jgi:hypothetical protein